MSLGCVLGELLLSYPLFNGSNEMEQVQKIVEVLGTPSEEIWPNFTKLPLTRSFILQNQPYNLLQNKFPRLSNTGIIFLKKLLTFDPERRITAQESMEHPFFSESPLPSILMPSFPPDVGRKLDDGNKNSSFS